MYLLTICRSCLETCLPKSLTIFKSGYLSFYVELQDVLNVYFESLALVTFDLQKLRKRSRFILLHENIPECTLALYFCVGRSYLGNLQIRKMTTSSCKYVELEL